MKTLIFAIVEEGKAERLMDVAKAAGSLGGTILTGQGSGASGLLSLLGLTNFHREILLTIVDDSIKDSVWEALSTCKTRKVLLTSMPLRSNEGGTKPIESTLSMICVICPSGYGWDVLHVQNPKFRQRDFDRRGRRQIPMTSPSTAPILCRKNKCSS